MTDSEVNVLKHALLWGFRPPDADDAWLSRRSELYARFLEAVLDVWGRAYFYKPDQGDHGRAGGRKTAVQALLLIQDAEIRAMPEYRQLLAEFSL